MGQTVALKCEKCNEEIILHIGQGIRDNDLTKVLSIFDEITQDKIKQNISDFGNDAIWEFQRMIAYCKNTKKITSVPTFHIINGDDKIIAENCDCKGDHIFLPIITADNKSEYCHCPKCDKYMSCKIIGLWD